MEAEEKVMVEVFKTDGHINSSIFNTDHNVSLLVKSTSHSRSVARSSPPVSVFSGVIHQPMRSVEHSMRLCNPPVSTEKKKTRQSVRISDDYDADSLQEQCLQQVRMVERSYKMPRSHDSTRLVYSQESNMARRAPSFPDPTAPSF